MAVLLSGIICGLAMLGWEKKLLFRSCGGGVLVESTNRSLGDEQVVRYE